MIALGAPIAISLRALDLFAAAVDTGNAPPAVDNAAGGGNLSSQVNVLTSYEFWLTVSILVFGAFIVIAGCRFLAARKENTPDQIIKLLSVTLIVIGTLVIITGGFSQQQIAPAFGLFGTIAGYLLGRTDRPSNAGKKADEKDADVEIP